MAGRPAHNKAFRDYRPYRGRPVLAEADRRKAYVGAQYSNTIQKWIPFCWDGRMLTMFEPKQTREVAHAMAWDHIDRMFSPERAELAD